MLSVKMMNERRRKNIITISAITGYNVLRVIIKRSEESSDDEYAQLNQEINMLERQMRIRGDLRHVARIRNYITVTVQDYSARQFKEHFRISRTTFESLERILTPDLIRTAENGRFVLDVRT